VETSRLPHCPALVKPQRDCEANEFKTKTTAGRAHTFLVLARLVAIEIAVRQTLLGAVVYQVALTWALLQAGWLRLASRALARHTQASPPWVRLRRTRDHSREQPAWPAIAPSLSVIGLCSCECVARR